jgi:hypothetical protein
MCMHPQHNDMRHVQARHTHAGCQQTPHFSNNAEHTPQPHVKPAACTLMQHSCALHTASAALRDTVQSRLGVNNGGLPC